MPSLFSMAHPFTAFQLWFVVYVYLLPILLYGVWASLALMDLMDSKQASLLAVSPHGVAPGVSVDAVLDAADLLAAWRA